MKLTQFDHLILAIVLLLFSSCNPAKLSSNYSLSSTAKTTETSPEKEAVDVEKQLALFAQALEKLSHPSALITIQQAAVTSWTYLGQRTKLLASDGRSQYSNVLSRTKTLLSFSELRQDQCPANMMCLLVYQPYVDTRLSNRCQTAFYRMSENLVMNSSLEPVVPVANFRWTVVAGEKTQGCENEDEAFFTTLSQQIVRNDPLILVSDNFLFIQVSSITYIFSR